MVKSRAEELMEQRMMAPPIATSDMVRSVSQYRRAVLEEQYNNGEFRQPGERWGNNSVRFGAHKYSEDSLSPAGNVQHNGKSFYKSAQSFFGGTSNSTPLAGSGGAGGSAGVAFRGAGGTLKQAPEVYSPLWLSSNLNLPRDRATINAWSRSFFALNPIVHNAITLHATYPIAKLNIKCKNPKIEQFYSEMVEELELMNICSQIAQEYWVLGEAFVYAELDEHTAKWSRLLLQNPDYITVKRSAIAGEPVISLRPDENLRRLIFSNRPSDIQQRRQLDPAIIEYVKRGQNIPLNNFYVSHIARKISPYEIRGTGLIVSCFRALMLFDQIRESHYVQATNMINPLTLIKIGNEEFRPTPVDLEAWREVFEAATSDKDFKIFTHNAVAVERVGYGQGIYDATNLVQQTIKEIYIGLMVPSVIMDGADTTYATGSVALDVLRQRYMSFRNYISHWLRTKIFAPIAKLNDFYEVDSGKKTLIIPEIDWNHMSLFDMADYIQNISQLNNDPANKRLSLQTLYRSLGVNYEDEIRKIKMEDIQDAIRRKELASLEQYTLNELRALKPTDPIDEVEDAPLPGESPYDNEKAAPEGESEAGGGGLNIGLPPMPSGPPPAPVGRPKSIAPAPPGGGTGIGTGGVPKPPTPS